MRWIAGLIAGLLLPAVAGAAEFALSSPHLESGSMIPKVYTCDKGNMSPELHWKNPPANTKSYALLGVAYDSPMGKIYGWVVYNIPLDLDFFPAGMKDYPSSVTVGPNSLGDSAYRGPCPPDSHLHHYAFLLYALDVDNLDISADATPPEVVHAIEKHTLAQAELKGNYQH